MPFRRFRTQRLVIGSLAIALVGCLGAWIGSTYLGQNWHVVIPQQIYRCAQLEPEDLRRVIARHGVRTVVNLRGCCPEFAWYREQCQVTEQCGISQEDITLSAVRLPTADEIRNLVAILERAERPLMIHCRQGIDRTGLASTMALLLHTERSLDEALDQLSLYYGHVQVGPTHCMHAFFQLYRDWLAERKKPHAPERFRDWAMNAYCPGYRRGELEVVDRPRMVSPTEPVAVKLRARNTAIQDWNLRPGTETGVHVRFQVFDAQWNRIQIGRAGEFLRTIPPGESVDLTLALAPTRRPGQYLLFAELIDGRSGAFSQYGSHPVEIPFQVRDVP